MREKLDHIVKHIPVITLLCYVFGFVIYKSFLLHYGINETDILNVRYIEAGILYLLIAPFVIATPLITNKKLGYFGSISTALFAFIIYNQLVGTFELKIIWKAYLSIIALNTWAFFIWDKYASEKERKLFDLTESPIFFLMLIITSLTLFSVYFKEIRTNLGGGKNYSKILILENRHDNLIKTDSLMFTDTLTIIYESNDFIFFKDDKNTKSIRKDLIKGEILIK